MNEIQINENEKIENLIYEINGTQVMLDSDLAKLYKCKNGTKEINQAVKNNLHKFPERFSWILTKEEYYNLRSKILTSNIKNNNHGGRRYNPRVFTEQGVAMLATVLKSNIAAQVSIRIMDAFIAMRHYIGKNLIEQKIINNLVLEDHKLIKQNIKDIKILQKSFNKFEEKRKVNEIYFNGQIFDAYYKIQEIFKMANKKLIVIDGYADNTILDIIKKLNIEVIIITKSDNCLTSQDVQKYNKQYHNLRVIYNSTFHDRYFIIDDKIVYHCGTSINRIGYKTFSINLISDEEVCNVLINKVDKIIYPK